VITGVVDLILDFALDDVQWRLLLKLLRITRLARAIRLVAFFPELYRLIQLFACAMQALFWGCMLIFFMLICWSVISLEFINPLLSDVDLGGDTETCKAHFNNLFRTALYFFQTLVVGDDWGTCINPLVDALPGTIVVFGTALVTIQLGFMNLILSAIVDAASSARSQDQEQRAAEHQCLEKSRMEKWRSIYKTLDVNNDGNISLEELLDGFETESDVREYLQGLDLNKSDLADMFDVMDVDHSGGLSYDEFVNAFVKATSQDARICLMMVRLQATQILNAVREHTQILHTLPATVGNEEGGEAIAKPCKLPETSPTSSPCLPLGVGADATLPVSPEAATAPLLETSWEATHAGTITHTGEISSAADAAAGGVAGGVIAASRASKGSQQTSPSRPLPRAISAAVDTAAGGVEGMGVIAASKATSNLGECLPPYPRFAMSPRVRNKVTDNAASHPDPHTDSSMSPPAVSKSLTTSGVKIRPDSKDATLQNHQRAPESSLEQRSQSRPRSWLLNYGGFGTPRSGFGTPRSGFAEACRVQWLLWESQEAEACRVQWRSPKS